MIKQMPDHGRSDEARAAGDKDSNSTKAHGLKLSEAQLAERAMNAQQILPIATLGATLRQLMEVIKRDITKPQRNLLGARNAHPLTLLEDLNEMAGFDKRGMSTGVKPREPAAQHLDIEISPSPCRCD